MNTLEVKTPLAGLIMGQKEIQLLLRKIDSGNQWSSEGYCYDLLHFRNHVNLIAVSEHHHHHNSDSEMLQLSIIIIIPLWLLGHFPKSIPELLRGYNYSKLIIITLSSPLAYLMSTLFGNHRWISPRSLYSTFGPSTCVSGYGHTWNDLLLLSHVYSMSQILPVVYSLYTSLYFPSFESWLSSSNLFSELSLSFVFATHNLPISFSKI